MSTPDESPVQTPPAGKRWFWYAIRGACVHHQPIAAAFEITTLQESPHGFIMTLVDNFKLFDSKIHSDQLAAATYYLIENDPIVSQPPSGNIVRTWTTAPAP